MWKQKTVRLDTLLEGGATTCGKCMTVEHKKKREKALKEKEFIENTQVGKIKLDKKPSAANKSGVVGVNWDKSRNRWQAGIRFKGKRYNLGHFVDFADAVEARKKAEQKIFGDFIEWYKKSKKEENHE